MRACVLDRPGSVAVRDVPDPTPGPRDVVVAVEACGICGTDLHIADGEFPPAPYPLVPGHEFAGTVVAVGSDVTTGIRPGARVAVDPSLFCGHCSACRAGRGNLCLNWGATGDTVDGGFAELVRVPAATCYALPDSMTFEQGALVEPLSCAVHGLRRLGIEAGESALVVGAGTMGLLLTQLLRRSGLAVTVVDPVRTKRDLAAEMGAERSVTSLDEVGDERFEAVIDVTGLSAVIQGSFDLVGRGGRFMVFGVAPADARVSLSPFRIYNDEITVVGSMAVLHSFDRALELIASGVIATEGLVSHRLPLEEFPKALDVVRSGEAVKVHVTPTAGPSAP